MKFKIIFSPLSVIDLEKIVSYYYALNKNTAKKYYNNIINLAKKLKEFPKTGRIVPECEDLYYDKYRETIYKHFRIIYKIDVDIIRIIRILNARMDITIDLIK